MMGLLSMGNSSFGMGGGYPPTYGSPYGGSPFGMPYGGSPYGSAPYGTPYGSSPYGPSYGYPGSSFP
jgi:hypothetical protein